MKKLSIVLALLMLAAFAAGCREPLPEPDPEPDVCYKPVIYLYPETACEVTVKVTPNAGLTCTWPEYKDGWTVNAAPEGTLTDPVTGDVYSSLFWEGDITTDWDLTEGFVVPGNETGAFLREKLAVLGLTSREANEFIAFWLPQMSKNAYNLITFQNEAYTSAAPMNVDPAPDSVLRVFMVYKALTKPCEVKTPELPKTVRSGFTVVEWGGTCVAD